MRRLCCSNELAIVYLGYQQDGLPVARWRAVTVRLSSGSWVEGGYLSFCPEEVTKSSPSSKWMQAFSTAWLPPRRGVTDLPHHSRANDTWKWVLYYDTVWRRHPMSSCGLAECMPEALGAGMKDSALTTSCESSNYSPTSSDFLRYLQMPPGQEFLLVTPRNVLSGIERIKRSQTTALLSHFVATTVWYEWGFFIFFFCPIKNVSYFKIRNSV